MAVLKISSRSSIESYLREIDKTPLLSRAQERELAENIAAGDVEARDAMVQANLRLVVCLARAYVGKGLSIEDLIAEGNMGLLRAVEGFNPDAETRFSTYAAYWIKQSIRRALNKSGMTNIPMYMTTLLAKWNRAKFKYQETHGRMPDDETLANQMGLSARQLIAIRRAIKVLESGKSKEPNEGMGLDQISANKAVENHETSISGAEEISRALRLVEGLDERDSTVMRLRFGLDGTQARTLNEIGKHLGLTRERVRQIEKEVLNKLKDHMQAA